MTVILVSSTGGPIVLFVLTDDTNVFAGVANVLLFGIVIVVYVLPALVIIGVRTRLSILRYTVIHHLFKVDWHQS